MRAKTYLLRIRSIDLKINNMQMQLQSLYDLTLSINVSNENERVMTSSSGDVLGSTVARIVDLQNEINTQIDKFVNQKLEAIRLINQLGDDEYINILYRRYVKYEDWQTIADDLHFTRQGVDKKHKRAIVEFQKILDNHY